VLRVPRLPSPTVLLCWPLRNDDTTLTSLRCSQMKWPTFGKKLDINYLLLSLTNVFGLRILEKLLKYVDDEVNTLRLIVNLGNVRKNDSWRPKELNKLSPLRMIRKPDMSRGGFINSKWIGKVRGALITRPNGCPIEIQRGMLPCCAFVKYSLSSSHLVHLLN